MDSCVVGPSQANYVLREIHEGSCSMHAGTRSVVAKALRTGYYWPTMHKDARALIKACQECQVHKPVPRNPQERLNPITSPWPFYKWGIDIAGPFPEGPDKVKFLIVAMDYFTKWIEAKPVATITGNQVKKFVWENIVCRFGLPGEIISDNGKQFRDNPFRDWCEKLCIQQHFAFVKHPQTNGLVERANRSLGGRNKSKIGNGDTLFSLTYGTEAVIPAEIGMPTFRTAEVDVAENDEALEINLELLEEKPNRDFHSRHDHNHRIAYFADLSDVFLFTRRGYYLRKLLQYQPTLSAILRISLSAAAKESCNSEIRIHCYSLGGLEFSEFVHDPQHVCSQYQYQLPLSAILRSHSRQLRENLAIRRLGALCPRCLHERKVMNLGKNGDDGDLLLFRDGPDACDISTGTLRLFISWECSRPVARVKVSSSSGIWIALEVGESSLLRMECPVAASCSGELSGMLLESD
ncbi:reverse transcriptase domain-containing protein [Tanacetum coccineum]